jgi:hypothetical protein
VKRYFIMVPAVVAVLSCSGCGKETALQVNDVAPKPAGFTGTVTVTGVMAARSQEDQAVFGVFDTRELKRTPPDFNRLILPVRYRGQLPVPGDEVRVTGSFLNEGRGYIFSADKLKVLKHHKPGG